MCEWPVLRLMLRQYWDEDSKRFFSQYGSLKDLQLRNVHLQVQVGKEDAAAPSGLSEIQLQNDSTVLDASKPFHPFGTSPSVGSRFYLAHPELICKPLDKLSFGVEWMGGPTDLDAHYKNYEKREEDKWTFKTRVSLVDNRVAYKVADGELFDLADASKPHTISIPDDALKQADANYEYKRSLVAPADGDLLKWRRYLQWELTPLDFQHQNYSKVSTKKSLEMAANIAKTIKRTNTEGTTNTEEETICAEDYQVNLPYTPKIKSLDLHYAASREIKLSNDVPQQEQVFHIHPFGYNEVSVDGPWFLPSYPAEGEFYLGIANVKPPQNFTVLFQMAEGSANPEQKPALIKWSYLSGERWLSLAEGGIRLDTTRGLINTGIIEFELKPADPGTRMPQGLYWIRATVAQHSDSVCDIVAIHTQVISATLP